MSFLFSSAAYGQSGRRVPDDTSHKVQLIEVQPGVKLEVLDYGGIGRPMVFLAALGQDAHDWDRFAPKFVARYHVYAITRRGFGSSDKPEPTDENYESDRLGDDVLAVMSVLHLEKPVLVGFSVGGEELSSVGSRFPEKVSGLVYLDAGYPYALYDAKVGEPLLDRAELRRLLRQAEHEMPMSDELRRKLLASMQRNEDLLRNGLKLEEIARKNPAPNNTNSPPPPPGPPMPPQMIAIRNNGDKYTQIPVPILAIYAVPVDLSNIFKDPEARAKVEAEDAKFRNASADAFEKAVPSARVVRIPHATHDVFASNETQVMTEMDAFLARLQ